jgi:hypothetical protein
MDATQLSTNETTDHQLFPDRLTPAKVKVKITLRLTVSQSSCLDVESLLVLMTTCLLLFDYYYCDFVGRPL